MYFFDLLLLINNIIMKNKKNINIIPISLFCLIISFTIINIYIKNNFSFKLAEMHIFINKETFLSISKKFSNTDKNAYLFMALTLDILWPITYSIFFYFINAKVCKIKNDLRLANIIIFLLFTSDMIENFSTCKYLYTNKSSYIYISFISTNIKWLFFTLITIYTTYKVIQFLKQNPIKSLFYN